MKLSESIRSERGVSPVIGVILMVAITVILAAVIGSFVLGIGGDIEQAPQASLSLSEADSGGNILVAHQGGDTIQWSDTKVTVGGGDTDKSPTSYSELSPGESQELDHTYNEGDTVRFIDTSSGNVIYSAEL